MTEKENGQGCRPQCLPTREIASHLLHRSVRDRLAAEIDAAGGDCADPRIEGSNRADDVRPAWKPGQYDHRRAFATECAIAPRRNRSCGSKAARAAMDGRTSAS